MVESSNRRMRIVDLISGCGGFVSKQDGHAKDWGSFMASEIFKPAIDVVRKNHSPRDMIPENVANLVDY